MRAACIGLVSTLVACAPDEAQMDLPIDVCGQDEPVQILALEDEQVIHPEGGAARHGERWLFGVKTFEIPLTKVNGALGYAGNRPYQQIDAAIVATGDCGEDPRIVAEGLDIIAPRLHDDEPWLGCRDGKWGLYWFDPDGAWSPRRIGDELHCADYVLIGRDVIFYAGDGELARARLDGDEIHVEILLDGIRTGESITAHGDEPPEDLVFVREDDTVVAVDLRTGELTTLAEGIAHGFLISQDRRWLVWFEEVDEGLPLKTWLRDLHDDIDRTLGRDDWAWASVEITDSFALIQGQARWGSQSTQLLVLPSQREEWFDGLVSVLAERDGEVLVLDNSGLLLLELESGERRTIDHSFEGYSDGTFWSLDPEPYQQLELSEALLPWDIVATPLETLEPEIARKRVFSSVDVGGDRWVVASERDGNELVELHYLDGATLEHRAFAHDVVPGSFDSRNDASIAAPWRTDELIYQMHTRASDRTGVWRVRFTP